MSVSAIFLTELVVYSVIDVDPLIHIVAFYISALVVALSWESYGPISLTGGFSFFASNLLILYILYRIGYYNAVNNVINGSKKYW